jgi:hypothetical protein
MSAHTPGPWNFYPLLSGSENHKGYRIQDRNGWIADCSPRDEDGKEGGANARLICAAPDLLEALQSMISVTPGTNEPRCVERARAAIAKATTP